jgi:hypothetical protein
MTSLRHVSRTKIALGLLALGVAPALSAAGARAANEVVTGVISCTSTAPRSATIDGTSGIIDDQLVCSSRTADGNDCTEQIRRDLDAFRCTYRRGATGGDQVLYFVCSGPRAEMVEVIDLVCRRLNGF